MKRLSAFSRIIEFWICCQRRKGAAAVFIELSEILQALQTQVMHIAAQEVQREVQRMPDQENDQEEDQVVCDPADGIEDGRNYAARQHQRHNTGIGKNISEPTGQCTVQGTEDAGKLPETLRPACSAVENHHAANDQNHFAEHSRNRRRNCSVQRKEDDADQRDPEGTFFP